MTRAEANALLDLIDLLVSATAAHSRAIRDHAATPGLIAPYARFEEEARTRVLAAVEALVEGDR